VSAAQASQAGTPTRRAMLAITAAVLLLPAVVGRTEPANPRVAEPPVRIEVRTRPILAFEPRDPSRQRFGQLAFRGGLELTSPYQEFGGVSAIRVGADGARFLALTDKGRWLRGRITYDGIRPTGIADAEMVPILGGDGRPLAARRWYDTESLAEADGTVYVGIERVHQIVRLDYGKHGLLARGLPIPVPPGFKQLPSNGSIEALEFVPKGQPLASTLIAISERGYDEAGNLKAFLIGGPSPGTFAVKRSDDFDVSDCALLPPGELLILERRYSLMRGVAMRIRRIPLASIKPGALVDGPVVVLADMGYEIDNMEALSVHHTASGDTVLTLISDDNFSAIQRTILLQFTLIDE
jgi:hypothetical protein